MVHIMKENFSDITSYSREGYELYVSLGHHKDAVLIIGILLSVTVIFPIISNGLILITFYKFRCLRTIHDILIISLAILNFVAIFGIPLHVSCMFHPMEVLTNKYLCLTHTALFRGAMFASLLILLGLAIERLVCIVYPEFHRALRKRHVVTWSILSISLGNLLFALPVLGWNDWETHGICSRHVLPDSFRMVSEILIFTLLIVNSAIHCYVFSIAKRHVRKISSLVRSVRRKHLQNKRKQRSKAFVTVFILAFVSTLCWLPQLITIFIMHNVDIESPLQRPVFEASYIPVVLNSGLSPLIYGYRNRHFKCAIRSMLCKRKHDCDH